MLSDIDPTVMAAIIGGFGLVLLRMLDKLFAGSDEARLAREELRAEISRVAADRDAERRRRIESESSAAPKHLTDSNGSGELMAAFEREHAARMVAESEVARLRRALIAAVAESSAGSDDDSGDG